jgi:2-dehydro-3-deoxyphosphogluconate aldolase/(4S)-4-hydroxy-2-oxoglutarate aldolase
MDVDAFKRLPIMGILRGGSADIVEPLVETVVSAGLETLEIAMNSPEAPELLRGVKAAAGDRLTIGAGTVLTQEDLASALEAGATFIVLPTLFPDVVARCAERRIPVFPGALTPLEIHNAWCAGATMVKVFPAKFFGPAYFQEIKGPFPDVELLACGGVSSDSIGAFFACGASAVAFGASVFRPEWLVGREFSRIGESIETLIAEFRRGKSASQGSSPKEGEGV